MFNYFAELPMKTLLTCLCKGTYDLKKNFKNVVPRDLEAEFSRLFVIVIRGLYVVKKNGLRSEGGKEELKPQPVV
jgi:hypothetical protein